MPENNPQPFPVSIDESVTQMPDWLTEAYSGMNAGIADQYARYGAIVQTEHLVKSREAIWSTAQTALRRTERGEVRTAVILGAGCCYDIPLEEITTEFDQVTLVDADMTQTQKAVSGLPGRLADKVVLQQADVTGTAARFGRIIEEASQADRTSFISQAAERVNELALQPPTSTVQGEYSFTCSQLLMSQLGAIPIIHLSRYAEERYGAPLTLQPGLDDEALVYALNNYTVTSHSSHVGQIAELTRPNGTAHFADTVLEVKNGHKLPMIGRACLEAMEESFIDLAEPEVWTWTPDMHRIFWVMSKSLASRNQAISQG